jgi:hypothetical protein
VAVQVRFQQHPRTNAGKQEGDSFMKNHWLLASLLAASMTIATAETWGQELSAEVPFPFHANGADLPAGHYTISRVSTNGIPVLKLTNFDARKTVLAVGQINDYGAGKLPPRMVFHCLDGDCALAQIWGSSYGVDLPRPHPRNREKTLVTIVPVQRTTKAD